MKQYNGNNPGTTEYLPGSRGEKLNTIINQAKKDLFTPDYQASATDEKTLGIIISQYFKWDARIIKCFLAALEDANFHELRGQIEDLIENDNQVK